MILYFIIEDLGCLYFTEKLSQTPEK